MLSQFFLRAPNTKLVLQQSKVFLTCLFVWASDELIGNGTDWLLLREGGNFSVILWLIIALKYVTVPTPSEVFDRKLWCVFTQAGRQTDSYLAPTPWEVTQLLLTMFTTDACMFQTVMKYGVTEKMTLLFSCYHSLSAWNCRGIYIKHVLLW